jgi:hypothetical protein
MSDRSKETPLANPDEQTPVNPFLVNMGATPKGPAPPRKVAPPAPSDESSPSTKRPRRVVRPAEYELRAQPGVESPVIKDAHREFRRGSILRPLGFVLLAGLVLGGLIWFVRPPEKKEVPFEQLYAPPKREPFAIGTSMAPDRIPEPEIRPMPEKLPDRRIETPPRPSGIVPSKQFADEFKSQAEKKNSP